MGKIDKVKKILNILEKKETLPKNLPLLFKCRA